ncbi:hypothetical protein, partial [Salmonella sp. s57610]|uniref:hypothetical protein n=1 Tax=Salmonella sp. s57610 TaxID=3159697 RepID=UPI00398181EF
MDIMEDMDMEVGMVVDMENRAMVVDMVEDTGPNMAGATGPDMDTVAAKARVSLTAVLAAAAWACLSVVAASAFD